MQFRSTILFRRRAFQNVWPFMISLLPYSCYYYYYYTGRCEALSISRFSTFCKPLPHPFGSSINMAALHPRPSSLTLAHCSPHPACFLRTVRGILGADQLVQRHPRGLPGRGGPGRVPRVHTPAGHQRRPRGGGAGHMGPGQHRRRLQVCAGVLECRLMTLCVLCQVCGTLMVFLASAQRGWGWGGHTVSLACTPAPTRQAHCTSLPCPALPSPTSNVPPKSLPKHC